MSLVDESCEPCSSCKERPATAKYTYTYTTTDGTFSEMVCTICFDRRTVQDALEGRFVHTLDLVREKRYGCGSFSAAKWCIILRS
jgi:hypothetical protein